jgi:hypothetical protein
MVGYIIFSPDKNINTYKLHRINNILCKRLLFNKIHNRFKKELSKEEIIKNYNIKDEELEKIEDNKNIIIIPMLELNEEQLKTYLSLFENELEQLDKYSEILSMIIYNQVSAEKLTIKKELNIILEKISNYWEDTYNLIYDNNKRFLSRKFRCIQGENQADVDYLREINDTRYSNIKDEKKYYINSVSNFTNSDVLLIYNNIPSDYLKYMFVCNLLSARTHSHLILNNNDLLEILQPMFEKYKIVFKYLIGYGWLSLRLQENNKKFIKDNDVFVLDIDTANKLPIYPFTYEDINQNPYASILINKDNLDLKNNCLSLNMMKDYTKYYGVCDSVEFKRRLNIFINSVNHDGILQYIDWNNCVITGSAMTACAMKYNPLFDLCKLNNNQNNQNNQSNNILTDADLNNFFFHYYSESDVDIVVKSRNMFIENSYLDIVDKLNINLNNNNYKTEVTCVRNGAIMMSNEFIEYELENISKILENPNITVNSFKRSFNLENIKIKEYFYNKYYINFKDEHVKVVDNLAKSENIIYKKYLEKCKPEELRIHTLNYQMDESEQKKLDFEKYIYLDDINKDNIEKDSNNKKLVCIVSDTIRYQLKMNNARTLEIFKGRGENHFSTISRFHMDFVRAYWNGKTVKCLPSFITSMMLQLSTDYKYFASVRSPIDIINKYRSRGFGIILNKGEKSDMSWYNNEWSPSNENNKWKKVLTISTMFGAKDSNNGLFKYSKITQNLPDDCYQITKHITTETFYDAFSSFINDQNQKPEIINLIKHKSIADNGSINKLDRYIYKFAYDIINSQAFF